MPARGAEAKREASISVNKVILVGRLGGDPETRTSSAGMVITSFNLATDDRVKKGDAYEKVTDWHKCVCFGKTAENVARFVRKGKEIYLEGKVKTRKWEDKDGATRYTTEIIVDQVQFIGPKDPATAPTEATTDTSSAPPDDDIPF